MLSTLKAWAKKIKNQLIALHFAYKNPNTPWYAKFIAGFTLLYALSPVDLIPDFIPVLGLLDDLILLPLGIWACIKMMPSRVWTQSLALAKNSNFTLKNNAYGIMLIATIWLAIVLLALKWYNAK